MPPVVQRSAAGFPRRRGFAAAVLTALTVPLMPAAAAHAATAPDVALTLTAGVTDLPGRGTTTLTLTITNNGDGWTEFTPVVHLHGTAGDSYLSTSDPRCASDDRWATSSAISAVGMGCAGPDQLAPGASLTFVLDYTAGLAGGEETLTADATPGGDTATLVLHAAPYVNHVDLSTTSDVDGATPPGGYRPGDAVPLLARYRNDGQDATVHGYLRVTASEPASFAPRGDMPYGVTCTGGTSLQCDLGSVWPGAPDPIGYAVTAPPRTVGQKTPLTLTTTISSDAYETGPANNSATTDVVVTAPAQADLGVTVQTAPGTLRVGGMTSWSVTANNAGPDAVDAALSVTVPAGLNPFPVIGAATTLGADGATTFTWQPQPLTAGASRRYEMVAQPTTPGTYTVTAAVTAPGAGAIDPDRTDDTAASAPITVGKTAVADLSATVSGPPALYPGRVGTWTLTTGNAGPDAAATGPSVTFPAGLTLIGTDGALVTHSGSSTVLTWPVQGIAAGATLVRKVTAKAPALGTYTVTARAYLAYIDGTSDPNTANNSGGAATTVAAASRTVTVGVPSSVQWSDTAPVDVTVRDKDGLPAAGATVTVRVFGRTYTAKTDASGRARVNAPATTAPGATRQTVTASVASDATHLAASGTASLTVGKEDGQLRLGAVAGGYRKVTTVNVQLLDPTAAGYSGLRRESGTATRADVGQGTVTVKIYYGRTVVGTYNQRMSDLGKGIGQAPVRFTPTKRGTYTVVAYMQPGSRFYGPTLNRTVTVR
jgi:Domain of unknown function DUF11